MDAPIIQLLLKYLRKHGQEATFKVIEEFIKTKERQEGHNYSDLKAEMIEFIVSLTE